jgi:hypothetical protein
LLTIRSTVYVYPLLIGNSHKPSHLPRAAVHQRVIEHSLDGYPLSNPHLRSTLIISGNDQKKKGKNIPPFSSGRTPWLQHPETLVARNQHGTPKSKKLNSRVQAHHSGARIFKRVCDTGCFETEARYSAPRFGTAYACRTKQLALDHTTLFICGKAHYSMQHSFSNDPFSNDPYTKDTSTKKKASNQKQKGQ